MMSWTGFDWTEDYPRFVVDLTGDGRADILGFGFDGVWVALNMGDGTFAPPKRVLRAYGTQDGWHVAAHIRLLADLTGDGRPDIVGFGNDYIWTALGNGDGTFVSPGVGAAGFGYNDGWRVDQHPRLLADLTGDGRPDIVGFGDEGVWTALGLGNGSFNTFPNKPTLEDFGAKSRNAGVLPVKRAVISLDHLHCHKDGEIGEAEPYLLVAFFKVDGETNTIGVDNGQLAIVGPCTFRGTAGTHGNLDDTTVNDGDDVPIPPELGRVEFELKPITPPDAPELGLVSGFCGVVVALVEENWVADDGAESGHRAFDRTLERLINEILPTLRQDMPDPLPPGKLEDLKDEVADRIKKAVLGAEAATFFGIFRLFNADVLIGADLFVADQPREIHARLQRFLPGVPPPSQPLLTHDYELFRSIAVEVTDAVPALGQGQGTWEVQHRF
jgi:hypothetical protein